MFMLVAVVILALTVFALVVGALAIFALVVGALTVCAFAGLMLVAAAGLCTDRITKFLNCGPEGFLRGFCSIEFHRNSLIFK